jgi:hypothetical protein
MRTIPLESDIRELNLPREYISCFFDSDMSAIRRLRWFHGFMVERTVACVNTIINPSAVPYIPAKFPGAARRGSDLKVIRIDSWSILVRPFGSTIQSGTRIPRAGRMSRDARTCTTRKRK